MVAKGFFYHQGDQVEVSASFAGDSGGTAYYTVQSNDTWTNIAATLYGSEGTADELAAALGNPVLVPGDQLTGLPTALIDDEATESVPPYYLVPVSATWSSVAEVLYGSSAVAESLEVSLSGIYTLAEGEHILASDLPSTYVVAATAPM